MFQSFYNETVYKGKKNHMRSHSTDTRSRLDLMFLRLCSEKPMNKIRIGEISDLAGCNRRTFYNYYEDIDDMKRKIIARFMAGLDEVLSADPRHIDEDFLNYMLENRELMKAFAGKNLDPVFVHGLIDTYLKHRGIEDTRQLDTDEVYPYMYNVFGTLMCVNCWIVQDEADHESITEQQLKETVLALRAK